MKTNYMETGILTITSSLRCIRSGGVAQLSGRVLAWMHEVLGFIPSMAKKLKNKKYNNTCLPALLWRLSELRLNDDNNSKSIQSLPLCCIRTSLHSEADSAHH
jgi:hypothetical protein